MPTIKKHTKQLRKNSTNVWASISIQDTIRSEWSEVASSEGINKKAPCGQQRAGIPFCRITTIGF
jgi:hypothetical protein